MLSYRVYQVMRNHKRFVPRNLGVVTFRVPSFSRQAAHPVLLETGITVQVLFLRFS